MGPTIAFSTAGGDALTPAAAALCYASSVRSAARVQGHFWPELVSNQREWLKTAKYCPGIGKGPLIRIASVQEQAREMREGHPGLYK